MKKTNFDAEHRCDGIPLKTTLRGVSGVSLLADVRYRANATKEIRRDDAVWAVDWAYLGERLRRVAAARSHGTLEALAAELAGLVLADIPTRAVEISLRRTGSDSPVPGAETCVRLIRKRDASLGPSTTTRDAVRARFARILGLGTKVLARPFHALFPRKRWIIPSVDPPRCASLTETAVPRILWQTNFTDRCSLPVWWNYLWNRRHSRDFEHRYVSTEARADYVHAHAPARVAAAYDRLTDGAAQADLWRLIALYEEGGVYLDMDAALVRPLSEILAGKSEVWLWDRKRFSNYFLATKPRNPIFAEFIDRVVDRIEHHSERRERTVFYVTGPGALEEVLDVRPDIRYLPRNSVALTGVFTDERYQYIDRPKSKWVYKRTFMD